MAVAGLDFAVVGSDTRLSSGYSILSRDVPKTVILYDYNTNVFLNRLIGLV